MGVLKDKKTWLVIVAGAIVELVLANVLNIAKTGVVRGWSELLTIITLGSATIRDAPYSTAALNPYPLPSLILLVAFITAASMVVVMPLGVAIARRMPRKHDVVIHSAVTEDEKKAARAARGAMQRKWSLATVPVLLIVNVLPCLVFVGVVNQAIAARRIYEADRDIVAPFMTAEQARETQAKFAAIETKAEYLTLMRHLHDVAAAHGIKLRPGDDFQTWY